MALKKFKPTTSSQRFKIISAFDDITTATPEKSLLAPKKKSGGRNNQGKMTMRYIGGGHKQKYRIIDFKRDKDGIPATVKTIEYDPNRTARIALIVYADGEKRYIIAPNGLKVGDKLMSGEKATPEVGNAMLLRDIPFGTIIHNIELRPGQGAKMARSAGSYAQLVSRDGKFLYTSTRDTAGHGRDRLTVLAVEDGENLSLVQTLPAEVVIPRHINIDPGGAWLLVCGQKSNEVALFHVESDGHLRCAKRKIHLPVPKCVNFGTTKDG